MTAAGIDLAMARREAESEMREKCRITRESGERGPWNPETLKYDAAPPIEVYAGKCKLRFSGARTKSARAGDQLFVEQGPTLSVPVRVVGIRKDDRVEIIASADDTDLVGVIVFVDANRSQTNATSRRLPVRETQ